MQKGLILLGSAAGLVGIAICLIAGLGRISGHYYLLGFESTTVFNGGVGIMVFACLIRLEELAGKARTR